MVFCARATKSLREIHKSFAAPLMFLEAATPPRTRNSLTLPPSRLNFVLLVSVVVLSFDLDGPRAALPPSPCLPPFWTPAYHLPLQYALYCLRHYLLTICPRRCLNDHPEAVTSGFCFVSIFAVVVPFVFAGERREDLGDPGMG